MSDIVLLRMERQTAIDDFNKVFMDNKYMLQMIFVLLGAIEEIDNPIAKKALKEFDELWKLSGRGGKHRTIVKKIDDAS